MINFVCSTLLHALGRVCVSIFGTDAYGFAAIAASDQEALPAAVVYATSEMPFRTTAAAHQSRLSVEAVRATLAHSRLRTQSALSQAKI